jgi:uncharacterized protein (DUF433 family)
MPAATEYPHIVRDDVGIPWIEGANTKVVEVVLHWQAAGLAPEQLHLELPHLSLGQIYSALAFYWDHRDEVEDDIERRQRRIEGLRRKLGQPPIVEKVLKMRREVA